MKVNIVGRHLAIPSSTEEYTRQKFGKLDRFFVGIQRADVVLGVDGHGPAQAYTVEATVVLGHGTKLVGKAQAPDLTAAIDQSESRLQKQIRRFHARLKSHRARDRIGPDRPATREEEEATYEQVVREMLEEGQE
jgi:putative sigma-54 modulation protein